MHMYSLLFSEEVKLCTCIAFFHGGIEAVHMNSWKLCACIAFCSAVSEAVHFYSNV